MKNLKINKLAENRLNEKEMKNITGGGPYLSIVVTDSNGKVVHDCGCGCYYVNNGGSSTGDNFNANLAKSLHSPVK